MATLNYETQRTHVRRQPARGQYDQKSIYAVLDEALVAHVAFLDADQPFCIPIMQARIGDSIYVHGASTSRALRILGDGAPACVTVTLLDGLVLARSAFEHSANYRSAVLLGSFHPIQDPEERLAAFEALTNKLVPGRWDEVRGPNRQELKATTILSMTIAEASVKSRSGPPTDDGGPDAALETWAGVLPIHTSFGVPEPSPGLRRGISLDHSICRLVRSAPNGTEGGQTNGRPRDYPSRRTDRASI